MSNHLGRYPIISDFSETYYLHLDDKSKDAKCGSYSGVTANSSLLGHDAVSSGK
jgi:hypothetical protein